MARPKEGETSMSQNRNATICEQICYVLIAFLTITATIGGAGLFLSSVGDGQHTLLRIVIGFPAFGIGIWLMFVVYKGKLREITRFTGGIILGAAAVALILMGIAGFASITGMGLFAGIFALLIGVGVGQLAVCCINPKYADALAERDLREMKAR